MKRIIHKIKLVYSKLKWMSSLVLMAVKYRKEVKELNFIQKKRKELMFELLSEQRLDENSDKILELRSKISIINEILKICS